MGRILGRVEYSTGGSNRFFIHDDTTGWSFPPLFANPAAAWDAYDRGEGQALRDAVPKRSAVVMVIRKVLALGHAFDANGETDRGPSYGLATEDRLLYPLSSGYEEARTSFLKAGGVLHIAEDVDGGFSGNYDHPLCAERWNWSKGDEPVAFEDLFNQPLDLCPHCVAALIARRD
jgi:hypothetical protein